jgi:hypothetical protein
MEVSKKKIDLYQLRDSKGEFCWADIAIDSGFDKSGDRERNWFRISISSDYGEWAYFWSHPGDNWREFLCKVSMDYVAGKFDCDRYFDLEATVRSLKQDVINWRKDKECGKDAAREAFDAIETAKSDRVNNEIAFQDYLSEQSGWADLWGEFIKHLNIELKVQN